MGPKQNQGWWDLTLDRFQGHGRTHLHEFLVDLHLLYLLPSPILPDVGGEMRRALIWAIETQPVNKVVWQDEAWMRVFHLRSIGAHRDQWDSCISSSGVLPKLRHEIPFLHGFIDITVTMTHSLRRESNIPCLSIARVLQMIKSFEEACNVSVIMSAYFSHPQQRVSSDKSGWEVEDPTEMGSWTLKS